MENTITIKINGCDTAINRNDVYEVYEQLRKIVEREDVTNTLDCCEKLYTDGMVNWILDNMWNYLWQDSDFSWAYDRTIEEMAVEYIDDLKEKLMDKNVRFQDRQKARAELKELTAEEIA